MKKFLLGGALLALGNIGLAQYIEKFPVNDQWVLDDHSARRGQLNFISSIGDIETPTVNQGEMTFFIHSGSGDNQHWTRAMTINNNRNVGIGLSKAIAPNQKLTIQGWNSRFALLNHNGTSAGVFELYEHDDYNQLRFQRWGNNASLWEATVMTIDLKDEFVGIGTTSVPYEDGFLLGVNGGVICERVKVEMSENWGDFVFNKNYSLMSLDKVEEYIDENSHLPNIPSATEIEEDGLELGEMQRLQMIKIEELTLHLIAMKKEMELLKAELAKVNN